MMLYTVISGHYEGSSDSAYLHGVFSTKENAERIAAGISGSTVVQVELDSLLQSDPKDYYGRPGYRII